MPNVGCWDLAQLYLPGWGLGLLKNDFWCFGVQLEA